MTRAVWTCWQQQDDGGFQIWLEPRENEKPFTDSERTQRWRLSLASLLFLTILLSDHLWFCAEAKHHRDKFSSSSSDTMGIHPASPPQTRSAHSSLRGNDIFIGNSTKHLWRLETCHHHDSLSKDCFTFGDADTLCKGLSRDRDEGPRTTVNMSDLYLSFCNSYSLLDLFNGSTSPDNLNCSLDVLVGGDTGDDMSRCSLCVQAYQRYDTHAQEKYEDFELMTLKYETDAYSVRTCMEQCKMAYKPWLCAQYFPTSQTSCQKKVPCHQYCLAVQQSCPYILPDNDDLIQGGSPSFICTGLLGDRQPESEAECCDIRWDAARVDQPSGGTHKRTPPPPAPCQPTEGATVTSAATATPRLCGGRLKICLLALVLLHTVIVIHTASHNSTGVAGESPALAVFSPEESAASNEE